MYYSRLCCNYTRDRFKIMLTLLGKNIPCLVLGIGNILWADEGFGTRAVEVFHSKYALTDPNNIVADGGTLGMYLYDMICRTDDLLIFDCCDFAGKPGELKVLRDDEISYWTSTKLSPHQDGMNDLLAKARLQGHDPKRLTVVGFQPVLLDDFGGSLSSVAKTQLEPAVREAYLELKRWGIGLRERNPEEIIPPLNDQGSLNISDYESGRPVIDPSEEGDLRKAFIRAKEQ